jgi:nucleoside-diphosphate-sugar epimerase
MLLEAGYEVTVLDTFAFGQATLLDCCLDDRFRILRGDARDESAVREAMRDADVLLPLAAVVGAPACDADRVAARTLNLEAIRLMLSLRSPSQQIVFPSTNSGYGTGERSELCTEESPLRPLSLYARTKTEAESEILAAGNAISLRLATAFGLSPRMRIDLLVNDFVYRAVHDRTVVVFQGHFRRNYIHVRDVARAFLHALDQFETMKDEVYNVGLSGANLTKLELCAEIKKQLPHFVYIEAPVGEDPDQRDYLVSNAKLEGTGFRPRHSLQAGIRELIKGSTILRNARYGNV